MIGPKRIKRREKKKKKKGENKIKEKEEKEKTKEKKKKREKNFCFPFSFCFNFFLYLLLKKKDSKKEKIKRKKGKEKEREIQKKKREQFVIFYFAGYLKERTKEENPNKPTPNFLILVCLSPRSQIYFLISIHAIHLPKVKKFCHRFVLNNNQKKMFRFKFLNKS